MQAEYHSRMLKNLRTPFLIYTTRKGALYQLTPSSRESLNIAATLISMGDFLMMENVLQKLKENDFTFKRFLGFDQQMLSQLTPLDHQKKKIIEGVNNPLHVKLSQGNGMKEISIDSQLKMADQIKPDVIVPLMEAPFMQQKVEQIGKRSHKRAVEKNDNFLRRTVQHQSQMDKAERPLILATLSPVQNEESLDYSLQKTCSEDIDGIVIHGLGQDESFELRTKQLSNIFARIPEDRRDLQYRCLSTKGNPLDILHGLLFNIHMFEVEYPFELAIQGKAILMDSVDFKATRNHSDHDHNTGEARSSDNNLDENKINNTDINSHPNLADLEKHANASVDSGLFEGKAVKLLDLKDKSVYKQLLPLQEHCDCYTCTSHTQAYIHHLLDCNEMTGQVLLTIHNVYRYRKLIEDIHQAVDGLLLSKYIAWFLDHNCA